MPIYEFKCEGCDDRFEVLVSSHRTKVCCPNCGHDRCTKLISTSSFILKGGGWYSDGYQKSGGKDE